jgi:hypothetical protein
MGVRAFSLALRDAREQAGDGDRIVIGALDGGGAESGGDRADGRAGPGDAPGRFRDGAGHRLAGIGIDDVQMHGAASWLMSSPPPRSRA